MMMTNKSYKHVFGPVPSRRLGMSLGVDLLTPKTCSLNCVYCESGKTTALTVERKEYVPSEHIIAELDDYLGNLPELDYVTFSGWGEPVLSTGLPKIVSHLKNAYPKYKIALLTNGTLFFMEQARKDVGDVDLVIASLDAVSPYAFKRLNRPHPFLDPEKIIQGLVDLRKEYSHELWLEIFIVPGLNDTEQELLLLSDAARKIGADKIQINTLDRPGTEPWVKPAEKSELERIQIWFDKKTFIGQETSRGVETTPNSVDDDVSICNLIKRRPCTFADLMKSTGLDKKNLETSLERLKEGGKIYTEYMERGLFYKPR